MKRLLASLAISLACSPLPHADVSAGASVGSQRYRAGDAARITPAIEASLVVRRVGLQAAGESTNRSYLGKVTALHLNATYTAPLRRNWRVTVGTGVTRVNAEATESGRNTQSTWNVAAELARKVTALEVFGRVRYFTYEFPSFRGQSPGTPAGPAVSLGVRYWFH